MSLRVLVRGVGDIGSAVAHRVFSAGFHVVMHDDPTPSATRRGMAFADAVFDGRAVLEGVRAVRAHDLDQVQHVLACGDAIPIYVGSWEALLPMLRPRVLIDARMRKHSVPEVQRGLAHLTIGLGPSLEAGHHADVVIETSWDGLGRVITDGSTLPLAGEPRQIAGHGRDRYVYAPRDGVFRTGARIGDLVCQGQAIAAIEGVVLTAPLDGTLQGLTRDGVSVKTRTKVIEVDPRGRSAGAWGIGERPQRIAESALTAIQTWERTATAGR